MYRVGCLLVVLLAVQALPAPAGAQTGVDGDLRNHPPKVIQIEGAPERVVPLAGGARQVTFSFMARDPNGWQDIARAEVALYAPDNVTHLRAANVTGVTGGDGASHWFNATFAMWYYEMPSGDERYALHIRVVDRHGAWSRPYYALFEYAELAAIQVVAVSDGPTLTDSNETGSNETGTNEMGFGETDPGDGSEPVEVVVTNTGNVPVRLELYGTHLAGPDGHAIPVDAVRYDLAPTLDNATALGLDPVVLEGLEIMPGEDSTASVWWRLQVPSAEERYLPPGTYSGSITLNAVAG